VIINKFSIQNVDVFVTS